MPSAAAARREASPAQSDLAETDVTTRFVGCYEMNASTETLPVRFALVADTVSGTSGLLEARYVDANGRLGDRILDAGWSPEAGRAVVKTIARGPILTLTRTGGTVIGQSPNGPRTGRVTLCR